MSLSFKRWIGVAIAITAITLPVQAQNVLTLRVESLDALIHDVDTIAVALGQEPGSGAGLVQMIGSQLGLHDLELIDGKNPLVIALPLQGMLLGQQGFVGAFPVADVDAAVASMKTSREGVTVDEHGMVHLPLGEMQEMLLLPSDGYLIYGQNANLIGGFDPKKLLSGALLPPGTIAAEFNVDSMRAMIGMTLEGARQSIVGAVTQGAEQGGEPIDAETAEALSGTIIEWMQALVANTRAVQLSVQLTDEHLVVHNHYLPVDGSTLGGFLMAQKGGMPAVARLLDGKDASMTMVANMQMTDAAIGALESFASGYSVMLQQMMKGQDNAALANVIPGMVEQYSGIFKCMSGEMAQVVNTADGLSFVQVSGIKDSDECRGIDKTVGEIMAGLPEEIDGMLDYSPAALTHGGIVVSKTSVQMDQFAAIPEAEAAEVSKVLQAMFGEEGFSTYMASAGKLWLGTGGAGAEDAMRAMIDRVQKAKSGQGIQASTFAPFAVNAGLYFSMDFGRLYAGLEGVIPDAEEDELAEVRGIMEALGAMTGAVELQPDALALKFAMSTNGLAAIAEIAREEAAAQMEHGDDHADHD